MNMNMNIKIDQMRSASVPEQAGNESNLCLGGGW
jgi:hypothetical protein